MPIILQQKIINQINQHFSEHLTVKYQNAWKTCLYSKNVNLYNRSKCGWTVQIHQDMTLIFILKTKPKTLYYQIITKY